MAIVAINAGKRSFVIIKPFKYAHITETVQDTTKASIYEPEDRYAFMPTIPERATTEPIDRSIMPEMISNVIPNDNTAVTLICLDTLIIFFDVRNFGLIMLDTTTNNTKIM